MSVTYQFGNEYPSITWISADFTKLKSSRPLVTIDISHLSGDARHYLGTYLWNLKHGRYLDALNAAQSLALLAGLQHQKIYGPLSTPDCDDPDHGKKKRKKASRH